MKIKITRTVPVALDVRPVIGEVYEVIREGSTSSKRNLYYIKVNGYEVGVFPDECEVIKDETTENADKE